MVQVRILKLFSFEANNKIFTFTIPVDEFLKELSRLAPSTPSTTTIVDSETHEFVSTQVKCQPKTLHQGSTSIYVFEGHQQCINDVRNNIGKCSSLNVDDNDPEMPHDEPKLEAESLEINQCGKENRSAENDEETVVIIRKRGNKVFVEF